MIDDLDGCRMITYPRSSAGERTAIGVAATTSSVSTLLLLVLLLSPDETDELAPELDDEDEETESSSHRSSSSSMVLFISEVSLVVFDLLLADCASVTVVALAGKEELSPLQSGRAAVAAAGEDPADVDDDSVGCGPSTWR